MNIEKIIEIYQDHFDKVFLSDQFLIPDNDNFYVYDYEISIYQPPNFKWGYDIERLLKQDDIFSETGTGHLGIHNWSNKVLKVTYQRLINDRLKSCKFEILFNENSSVLDLEASIFENTIKYGDIVYYKDLVHFSVMRYIVCTRYNDILKDRAVYIAPIKEKGFKWQTKLAEQLLWDIHDEF